MFLYLKTFFLLFSYDNDTTNNYNDNGQGNADYGGGSNDYGGGGGKSDDINYAYSIF